MAASVFPGSWECDYTNTTITARVTDPDEYSYFSWSLRTADGNTTLQSRGYSLARTASFTGLTPATTYRVYLSWSHSTSGEGNYEYDYVTTQAVEPQPERPDNWEWTSTVEVNAVEEEYAIEEGVGFVQEKFDEYREFVGDHITDIEYLCNSKKELQRPLSLMDNRLLQIAISLYK